MASRQMYATDASIYREYPIGVVWPRSAKDVQLVVGFAARNGCALIPRGAGTSLAGQCVGSGIVVDLSRYMDRVLSIDRVNGIAVVQPGVVRDELNRQLQDTPWWFGPNTSTSNRATMGGMVGNNSSGTTSIAYGVTRDKVIGLEVVLHDGRLITLSADNGDQPNPGGDLPDAVRAFYARVTGDPSLRKKIKKSFPLPAIHRRNTGYALDLFIDDFNAGIVDWTGIFCGSEGTLGIVTEIKVKLDKKPPEQAAVIASHFTDLDQALRMVPRILNLDGIFALELMDDKIIDCARRSPSLRDHLHFIKEDPAVVLLSEVRAQSEGELDQLIHHFWQACPMGDALYHHEVVPGEERKKVWELRAAGLGILSNMPGDAKPVACIEDTAVHPSHLADYIADFSSLMADHRQEAVYYAHAGAGELHLRPILNLKTAEGREALKAICRDSAALVKKYSGSLSGEHGDGRVRAPFIRDFYGEEIYQLFLELKAAFDPNALFNPGKIVDPKDITADLRWQEVKVAENTFFDYSEDGTMLRHAERCNGSGDCRKSHALKPGMCPTYQATGREVHTTRARANLAREALLTGDDPFPLAKDSLDETMSSCLACKACKTECPSGVDAAMLKAEYLHQRRRKAGSTFRDFLLAHPEKIYALSRWIPFGRLMMNSMIGKAVASMVGLTRNRPLPLPEKQLFINQATSYRRESQLHTLPRLALLIDEFINLFDHETGRACLRLLRRLEYETTMVPWHSGRAYISKGYLKKAAGCATTNQRLIEDLKETHDYILGIEPSALLTFHDEYQKMDRIKSQDLSRVMLIEDFLLGEVEADRVDLGEIVSPEKKNILYHGHCHQKALADENTVLRLLNSIPGWMCTKIDTGCCGMAGGFGYEKEHYDLSMQVANLGLFPTIKARPDAVVVASGMSCRHQIRDGLDRRAIHPATLLAEALGIMNEKV